MKLYSPAWKASQTEKRGGWAQYHKERKAWKWHYIANDTEYSTGDYFTRKDCEAENRKGAQLMNEQTFTGMTGGQDATFFEVVDQSRTNYTDYPAYDEAGNILSYSKCPNAEYYFSRKKERTRPAYLLTIAGNGVSCEHALRDLGHDAHNTGPHTVFVVING